MKKFFDYLKKLPQYASKPWYPFAMALIAFADYFLFVIPLDAMLVASVLSSKRHWKSISFWTCLGSTLGAVLFAILIQHFGDAFLQAWAPHLLEDQLALTITHWLQHYGFWALILIAAGPIHQHPTVAIAALAKVPLMTIFITMFVGRLFKYCVYTWLSTHAKKGLQRFFKE